MNTIITKVITSLIIKIVKEVASFLFDFISDVITKKKIEDAVKNPNREEAAGDLNDAIK